MGRVSTGMFCSFVAATVLTPVAICQEIESSSRSSSSSSEIMVEKKGYAFKYRQRLHDWSEQINTGLVKGWLTPADAQKMRERLSQLRSLEAAVQAKGYPKPELDDMEKQFTQFNIDLSHASEPKPAATANPGNSSVPTTQVQAAGSKKETPKTKAHGTAGGIKP
jgi:hypothetical protein